MKIRTHAQFRTRSARKRAGARSNKPKYFWGKKRIAQISDWWAY